jgi:hypothetical protein
LIEGKTPLEMFDHSQMVENVLKKSEEINNILDQSEKVLQNGVHEDKEDEIGINSKQHP